MPDYVVGQRWISDTESELGLGHLLSIEPRRITIHFPASAQTRTYASDIAPLTRVRFQPGDRIQSQHGWFMTVREVEEEAGLLTYRSAGDDGTAIVLPEAELAHHTHFNQPQERLYAGQIDEDKWFRLRCAALHHQQQLARSPVGGLIGARVELIPHQLYIADEVSKRHACRVLLADEVGLGKTIEAGLILHRLLLSERISRVLIVVPDALLHQWLVEMLRRFNVRFSLLDVEQFATPRDAEAADNPFFDAPHFLCGLDVLCQNRKVAACALAGAWDMLIVDEAHHLQWSPDDVSPAYRLVEALAAVTPSLLLLTATPEQLGLPGHFARLRLLDPQRFHDFDAFLEEEAGYLETAKYATILLDESRALTAQEVDQLQTRLGDDDSSLLLKALRTVTPEPEVREQLINRFIDRHGTGRVLFRNTRAAVQGFPERRLVCHPLAAGDAEPRLPWLIDHLRQLAPERALLICGQAQTAIDLAESLRVHTGCHAAVFHEGLSLIERDRAAAYFAAEESSAPVLICSEIGSEGRNFQFVHHVILFDLPTNPDVLEQRIGRLDRIGQEHTVYIHVPYIENSDEAFWLRWYHEGMDAFEHTCSIGPAVLHSLQAEYGKPLTILAREPEKADSLIDRTRALRQAKRALLEQGRDRLLELNSCRPQPAHALCEQIAAVDADVALRRFIERTCDCYGVHFEAHSDDCWIVQPSDHMYIEHFPGLPDVACMLTTSRDIAVRREDVQFLSWDHPLVRGALDLILHSGEGKATFGALHLAPLAAGLVLVEAVFRLACTADAKLNAQRYLPPTLIRVLIDAQGQDRAAEYDLETLSQALEPVPRHRARQLLEAHHGEIRQHIAVAAACADQQLPPWRERSVAHMRTELGAEWRRLAALARVNPSIRPDELQALQDDMAQLNEALLQSRMQMEALRVIFTY